MRWRQRLLPLVTLLLACGSRSELLDGERYGGDAVAAGGTGLGGALVSVGGQLGSAGVLARAGAAGVVGGGAAGTPMMVAGSGGNNAGAPGNDAGAAGESPQPIEDSVWAKRFGDKPNAQRANAIAVQPNGDFALTGSVQGEVDFGDGAFTSTDPAAFVAAFDADANLRYSKDFGNVGAQEGLALDVLADGTLAVAGHYSAAIGFGLGTLTTQASTAAFLASFEHDGTARFGRSFGDVDSQIATGVAMTSSGRALLVGHFNQSVDFGGGKLDSAGSFDAFQAGFDAQGIHVWSERAGDQQWQRLNAVARASDDTFLVAGALQGTAKLGACSTQTSQGGNDIWLGWLDNTGNCLRSARYGDFFDQEALAVAAGKSALSPLFAVVGRFAGTLSIGDTSLQADGQDAFVALFTGERQSDALRPAWVQRIGGAGLQVALGVTFDGQDNVIVVGKYEGQGENFDGGLRPSGGAYDAFAVKLDSSGKRVWSHAFGGAGDQIAYAVGTDDQNEIYVAGGFEGKLALSSGTLTSAGKEDIFVLKLSP